MEKILNYSVEELKKTCGVKRDMNSEKHVLYYDGKPLLENMDANELCGEVFRKGIVREKEIEASNYGRIRFNGEIIPQIEKNEEKRGYLIPNKEGIKSINVYEIIAEIWLGKHENMQVHHVTNNGYDNRPENLIYVPKEEHDKIHAGKNYNFLNYRIDIYSGK